MKIYKLGLLGVFIMLLTACSGLTVGEGKLS